MDHVQMKCLADAVDEIHTLQPVAIFPGGIASALLEHTSQFLFEGELACHLDVSGMRTSCRIRVVEGHGTFGDRRLGDGLFGILWRVVRLGSVWCHLRW